MIGYISGLPGTGKTVLSLAWEKYPALVREGGETMKAIIIKGLGMPVPTDDGMTTFVDARIYSDGSVLLPCNGETLEASAEEVNIEE